ncbi:MAG TPA: biotin--[acetyl-CoA-carboxylase] ligase [Acidimicrobiales bacterium]|nr:biotin--[acetyl-CoA-carboxylase] ligase [Acidimicrobiales bacterium]
MRADEQTPQDRSRTGTGEQAISAGALFADPERLGLVDSTNRLALAAASEGAAEGLAVVAEEQTAGRGRMSRSWVAPAGSSILCSLLFRPGAALERRFLLTSVVALAAASSAAEVAGVECSLKWPNDLLAWDRKVAGILAEASGDAVVVGIGVNVNWPEGWPAGEVVAELEGATALNRVRGSEVDREELLAALLRGASERYRQLIAEDGWRGQLSEYRRRCSTIGARVRVTLPDEEFVGTALDVDDGGHLLVDIGACIRTVAAGDVVHVRAG